MASGKVYSVDEVEVTISKTNPVLVVVSARGRASSSGWHDASLSRYIYPVPPKDGVQDFDFYAEMPKPGSIVIEVLTPISAQFEFSGVDIENYWGKGQPLKGVRVHAVANDKTVNVVPRKQALQLGQGMTAQATASYVTPTTSEEALGFEEDIKPMFRQRDVNSMLRFGPFDLHKYDDVKLHAIDILKHLRDDMPCDGLWPESDVLKFEKWKDNGMAP